MQLDIPNIRKVAELYDYIPWTFLPEITAVTLIVGAGIFLILALYGFIQGSLYKYRRNRRKRMSTTEREKLVKEKISDAVTEALEDLEYKQILTRGEVINWYKKFGNILSLPDLLPKGFNKTLKEQIKERLGNGVNNPVKLPDLVIPKTKKLKELLKK